MQLPVRTKDETKKYSKLKNEERVSMAVARRMGFGYGRDLADTGDIINNTLEYSGQSGKDARGGDLDDYDFIPLKFYSVAQNKTVQFRATLSGLSETTSPSWDSNKFMGSPFNYYTYTGIERSVQFNFKVYSLNAQEHMAAWNKLDFLTSLAYPQGYQTVGVIAPIIKLTLGNMYVGKTGFVESLSYTIDDNAPWEIGLDENGNRDGDLKNYKLPRVVDVSVTVKFIENKSTTNTIGTSVTLYGIKPYKKVALKQAEDKKDTSTDIAGSNTNTTTAGSVVAAANIDSKGILGGVDTTIVAKTDSYLKGLSGLTGVGKTTGTQVAGLGIAGPALSKEFAAATMKFDGMKSVQGITGKFQTPSIPSTLSIPPFNVGSAIKPSASPFNANGTIASPFAPNLKTNSFSLPTLTTVNNNVSKSEKPAKLSRRETKELEKRLAEQTLINNKAAYESLRNSALNLSGLGK